MLICLIAAGKKDLVPFCIEFGVAPAQFAPLCSDCWMEQVALIAHDDHELGQFPALQLS